MNTLEAFSIICPECRSTDSFTVEVTTAMRMTGEGTRVRGHHEWDDDSYIVCENCEREGTVLDFTAEAQSPPKEAQSPLKEA
jgi:hypothetical protein